jgi:hypothetical protein
MAEGGSYYLTNLCTEVNINKKTPPSDWKGEFENIVTLHSK